MRPPSTEGNETTDTSRKDRKDGRREAACLVIMAAGTSDWPGLALRFEPAACQHPRRYVCASSQLQSTGIQLAGRSRRSSSAYPLWSLASRPMQSNEESSSCRQQAIALPTVREAGAVPAGRGTLKGRTPETNRQADDAGRCKRLPEIVLETVDSFANSRRGEPDGKRY